MTDINVVIIIYRVPKKKFLLEFFLDCLLIAHFLLLASDFVVCCNQKPEVEFVHPVSAGSSVKFLPAV